MRKEEIKRLLERYYNAESTDTEEQILKDFFLKEIVPDELLNDKHIFDYFRHSSALPEPSADFQTRILSALDGEEKTRLFRTRRILLSVSGIAAAIAIIAGAYFFLKNPAEPRDTYSDPAIAYAETMKILYGVSYKLNQGARSLQPVSMLRKVTARSLKTVDMPARIMEKKLTRLDQLNRTVKTLDLINNDKK